MEIKIKNLNHVYMPNTPFEHHALKDINIHINSGQFVAIIGHTGSGKSTIVQHINGLLKPTSGSIEVDNILIDSKKKNKQIKQLRKNVGMVFQYPEHQLFDETVEKDIAFGPLNFGDTKEVALQKVKEVVPLVQLSDDLLQKSPFELSGGQKRRVAIAGVLVSKPSVLILDEPTAGLDPIGRKQMMELFHSLHKREKLTTILVTHSMEYAAMYANKIIVMNNGEVFMQGSPKEIFISAERLRKIGLDIPDTLQLALMVEKKFNVKLPNDLFSNESVIEAITMLLEKET